MQPQSTNHPSSVDAERERRLRSAKTPSRIRSASRGAQSGAQDDEDEEDEFTRTMREMNAKEAQAGIKVGRGLQKVGRGLNAVGTGTKFLGSTAKLVGAGTEMAGKGLRGVGSGAGALGSALSSSKLGSVLGAPIKALGAGAKGIGSGVAGLGSGVKSVGEGVKSVGQGAKNLGKLSKEEGFKMEVSGRATQEMQAAGFSGKISGGNKGNRSEEEEEEERRKRRSTPLWARSSMNVRNADGTTTKTAFGEKGEGRQGRERNFENRLRRDRLTNDRMQKKSGGLSMKDAMSLIKNPTPTGLAMKLATPSGGTGPGGIPMSGEDLKKMFGNGLIKMSWSNLWMTFGHSIYIIDILFFAGWASKYLRQYIPEVGKEWFPGEIGKKMPAHALLPLKLGEIVAMFFITFWVLIIDLAILGALGFILGAIMDAGRAVDSIPFL